MELLVCVADKVSGDPLNHPALPKRGDVVHAAPDASHWGLEDLRNPDWKVLSVPGLTEDEALALAGDELPRDAAPHELVLRPRGMRLDLDALGVKGRGDRGGAGPDLVLDAGAVRAAMRLKAPLSHPDLIGHPGNTIGQSLAD